MLNYNIMIYSKNKQSFNYFFLFFKKTIHPKIKLEINYSISKKKIKKISTLNSPHVSKNAQEQLEYRLFLKRFLLKSSYKTKYLLLLKKIKTKIFPELKIKIILTSDKKLKQKTYSINPQNFSIINPLKKNIYIKDTQKVLSQDIKINKIKPNNKMVSYLKIIDTYGELNLYNILKIK